MLSEDSLNSFAGGINNLVVSPPSKVPPAAGTEDGSTYGTLRLPTCEFCLDRAEFEGQTTYKRRSYMCARHFRQHGRGLENGMGRRLLTPTAQDYS